MNRVFVAMGSNVDSEHNMREAVRLLSSRCRVIAVSPVYETAPIGNAEQPRFLNAAVQVETDLTAAELKKQVLLVIERDLGRVRTEDKNAPRTIDLDIAVFSAQELDERPLTCHDPDILRYAHVAVPLADIAPKMRLPATGRPLLEIARGLPVSELVCRPDVVLWPGTTHEPNEESGSD